MKNIQKIGLGLGATALVLGGAAGFAGIAQAADPTADPTPAATTPAASPCSACCGACASTAR